MQFKIAHVRLEKLSQRSHRTPPFCKSSKFSFPGAEQFLREVWGGLPTPTPHTLTPNGPRTLTPDDNPTP
jgi:hypothetical protein